MFAKRIENTPKSFIREILKVTNNPNVISFAGGLPNPISFPNNEIKDATVKVLEADGDNALQYSTTEGYLPLREYISKRYWDKKGIKISASEILITNGSQQALDLIGKVFLEKDDEVLMEKPSYLGAIQAFSMFEPKFLDVELEEDGIDIKALKAVLANHEPKLFYTVPNFQNPSGTTYSIQKRQQLASLLNNKRTILIEDDPYGELRFSGEDKPSMKKYMDKNAILLGSFSKIISPGMRMGWICANEDIMEKLIIAKQAADLHSNYFTQRVIAQYLDDNDLDLHIDKIKDLYRCQRNKMVECINLCFPKDIKITNPEGGMFLWVTLPKSKSVHQLFTLCQDNNVVFVPGAPFYTDKNDDNTFRLNYTNSSLDDIEKGICIIGDVLKKL